MEKQQQHNRMPEIRQHSSVDAAFTKRLVPVQQLVWTLFGMSNCNFRYQHTSAIKLVRCSYLQNDTVLRGRNIPQS